jgi:hypothetical protein
MTDTKPTPDAATEVTEVGAGDMNRRLGQLVKAKQAGLVARVVEMQVVSVDGEIKIVPLKVPSIYGDLRVITDPEELLEVSMLRILTATSAEELFSDPDSVGLRDQVGKPLQILTVDACMPSTFRRGDVYVFGTMRTEPGGAVKTWSTGSPYAGGRAAQAQRLGLLPRWLRPVELESASNPGQSSLWLVDCAQPSDDEAAF